MGVFVDHDSYLESFELACELHTLKQQIAEYIVEEALKEQEKEDYAAEIDARAELLLNPETEYGDKYEAVMTDLLEGRHIVQLKADDPGLNRYLQSSGRSSADIPGLNRGPTDNDSDENLTEDY